jgi:hypothetical protein
MHITYLLLAWIRRERERRWRRASMVGTRTVLVSRAPVCVCVCVCVSVCLSVHIRTYVSTYLQTCIHVCVCTYIHVRVCTYIYIYIHSTYIHTYIHRHTCRPKDPPAEISRSSASHFSQPNPRAADRKIKKSHHQLLSREHFLCRKHSFNTCEWSGQHPQGKQKHSTRKKKNIILVPANGQDSIPKGKRLSLTACCLQQRLLLIVLSIYLFIYVSILLLLILLAAAPANIFVYLLTSYYSDDSYCYSYCYYSCYYYYHYFANVSHFVHFLHHATVFRLFTIFARSPPPPDTPPRLLRYSKKKKLSA